MPTIVQGFKMTLRVKVLGPKEREDVSIKYGFKK